MGPRSLPQKKPVKLVFVTQNTRPPPSKIESPPNPSIFLIRFLMKQPLCQAIDRPPNSGLTCYGSTTGSSSPASPTSVINEAGGVSCFHPASDPDRGPDPLGEPQMTASHPELHSSTSVVRPSGSTGRGLTVGEIPGAESEVPALRLSREGEWGHLIEA
ncbi:uncharacterized protein A4U43_C09F5730 [Asparagus officinalis]|uniref:Uncharacterized protein n=1 Tax=Asparagus officinalis TaxID=4686 RepID=A0A5P1E639_ASPOF|nr:uncharacterized protein A4U43_C09F5730 [Asparagus officinalis]